MWEMFRPSNFTGSQHEILPTQKVCLYSPCARFNQQVGSTRLIILKVGLFWLTIAFSEQEFVFCFAEPSLRDDKGTTECWENEHLLNVKTVPTISAKTVISVSCGAAAALSFQLCWVRGTKPRGLRHHWGRHMEQRD